MHVQQPWVQWFQLCARFGFRVSFTPGAVKAGRHEGRCNGRGASESNFGVLKLGLWSESVRSARLVLSVSECCVRAC